MEIAFISSVMQEWEVCVYINGWENVNPLTLFTTKVIVVVSLLNIHPHQNIYVYIFL